MKVDTIRNRSILVEMSLSNSLEGLGSHVWPSQLPEEWPGDGPWNTWTVRGKEGVVSDACSLLKVTSAERALTSGNGKAKS